MRSLMLIFSMPSTPQGSQKQKIEVFSHRCLIKFYETNRISHVPHLYDIVIFYFSRETAVQESLMSPF